MKYSGLMEERLFRSAKTDGDVVPGASGWTVKELMDEVLTGS